MAVVIPRKNSSKSKTFRATLERLRGNGLNWTIVRLSFDAEKVWGVRGMLRVRVRCGDVEYATSLFPVRAGGHFILIKKAVQRQARLRVGDEAIFTITPDLQPRDLKLPPELEKALKQDRALRKWFDCLNYTIRKWLSDLVDNAKSPSARANRADRVAEQVFQAMDAERELPPFLRLAFSRIPGAEKAWQNMTEKQRRHNLLAIFFYQSPEARQKRIERIFQAPQ